MSSFAMVECQPRKPDSKTRAGFFLNGLANFRVLDTWFCTSGVMKTLGDALSPSALEKKNNRSVSKNKWTPSVFYYRVWNANIQDRMKYKNNWFI